MKFIRHAGNTPSAYGWVSILLHWVVALAVIGLYPLGLYIVSLSYYDPGYRLYPDIHRSLGILLAMLLVIRLVWKLLNPSPVLLVHSTWERLSAKAGHLLLYLLLGLVLFSGYMLSTADGRSIQVFDWFSVPAIPALANRQEELAGTVHFYAATGLVVLAGVHALAALKHHFIDQNATLRRMLGMTTEKD
ncbi:cytochrome b [Marinospirillum alkaliphilum]|uniref:Cytochrome b561 n=1 Tax=Marinospirillum alkaliphilum DSM 21637 TaxID=1122209 RepID=A0A1K1YIM5_9GAMM|nr:cytochrome b [Marinospirillum alkaliphilum]SFX61784.1 cytochrome b561 [Marinospirillum alkaliphilum DSM 21637]